MISLLKKIYKFQYDTLRLIGLYIHDSKRYYFSAVYPFNNNVKKLEGKIIKRTHSIEKRLSFENRDPLYGREKAKELLDNIKQYSKYSDKSKIIFLWAINTLEKYSNCFLEHVEKDSYLSILKQIKNSTTYDDEENNFIGGSIEIKKNKIISASQGDFKQFSLNRHSVRSFSGPANVEKIVEAVEIASKYPSNCNLQPVKIYLIQNKDLLRDILKIQRGNRGFSERIPQLFVITSDLSLYSGYRERNQCFVDGGIFALSLVYSLHYMGIGSCLLNWASTKKEDNNICRIVGIPENEVVIVTMGIGELPDRVNVPVSKRRSVDEIMKILN